MSLRPLVEPVEIPRERLERLSRNIALPQLGLDGQGRLAAARILVVGAGGLGSPVLHYLAACGVGTIGIVDFDVVDESNLQRQVIHRHASIGELKTSSAARSIHELDPTITVIEHNLRLDRDNALAVMRAYDVIVDGSDNFATRYLANDAAALLTKPYVWGSVLRFDGQVTVFWEGAPEGRSIDYRDVHPTPPASGDVLSCDEAGVLGSVCGTVGSIMASETVKLVCGVGESLLGRLLTIDALGGRFREISISRRADRIPVSHLIDYDVFCGVAPVVPSITAVELLALPTARVIDVREEDERALSSIPESEHVPLADVLANPGALRPGPLVVYCASGARSARAVGALRMAGVDAVSLAGGIRAWERVVGQPPAKGGRTSS